MRNNGHIICRDFVMCFAKCECSDLVTLGPLFEGSIVGVDNCDPFKIPWPFGIFLNWSYP